MIYVICYDISCPKRLRRVAKCLENYGIRSQYSVFQCDLSLGQYNHLLAELVYMVDHTTDRLYSYPVCDKCFAKSQKQGTGNILSIANFEII